VKKTGTRAWRDSHWGVQAFSYFVILLIAIPVIALIARGLENQNWQALDKANLLAAIVVSLLTTLLSTLFIFLLGLPLAYFLAHNNFRLKNLLIVLIELPIVLPPTVAGLALLIAAGRRGLLGGVLEAFGVSIPFTMAAVVIAQVFVAAPLFIRAAQVGFEEISQEIEDAAHIDGASGYALFSQITFPLAFKSIAAGLTLSWARALGEFGATLLFAGSLVGRTQTLPLFIFTALESDIDAAVMASIILLAIAFLALVLSKYISRQEKFN
jgi:molybdate transport system permease protein